MKLCNFQLAALRRLRLPSGLNYSIVINVKSGDCIIGKEGLWFFLNLHRIHIRVKFDDAEPFRIWNLFGKNMTGGFKIHDSFAKIIFKNIIAEDHRNIIIGNKLRTYDE